MIGDQNTELYYRENQLKHVQKQYYVRKSFHASTFSVLVLYGCSCNLLRLFIGDIIMYLHLFRSHSENERQKLSFIYNVLKL